MDSITKEIVPSIYEEADSLGLLFLVGMATS